MTQPHLVVALSAHGFGHVTQAAPAVNALRLLRPDLRVTLCTAAPERLLRERYDPPFEVVARRSDFGMVMGSALDVQVAESAAAYEALHVNWVAAVTAEAGFLRALAPDLVLANVPYLSLAAAARLAVPALALCSLDWAAIYRHYCGARPEAGGVATRIEESYGLARLFIRPEPAMPSALPCPTAAVGPIARLGRPRRAELRRNLGWDEDRRCVLVAPGGIDFAESERALPQAPGIGWIVQGDSAPDRPYVAAADRTGLPFPDLTASVDALVTKPGYSSFAEAGCLGLPVLYAGRDGWPEEPVLREWLHRHTRALSIPRVALVDGSLPERLAALWALPRPAPAAATGGEQAAALIAAHLA